MNKNQKKYIILSAIAILSLTLMAVVYSAYFSTTRIAMLNFPDFTVEKQIRSNNNPMISIETLDLDNVEKITDYDFVMVRIHGSSMNATHQKAIEKAIEKGIPVFSTEHTNPKINTLKGRELEYFATLSDNESTANYRSMFNYIRSKIDKKIVSNKEYAEPIIVPKDYYFYMGEDMFFASFDDYQQFYEKSGDYRPSAPRVALISGNINLQNSNEEHIYSLIESLEAKGLNVYPINSFGAKKLDMIKAINPSVVINRPHGRLVMGAGEQGVDLMKELNIPILSPLTISDTHDNWISDKQGMTSGGMTSMSIVMPEIDGAIAPYAIAAQFERNGKRIFDTIPMHTEKFCELVKNYAQLQTKDNKHKKVAIYYYKGVGKGSINAAEIEGVESLYNTLKLLAQNGYNVQGLPQSAKQLEQLIQAQGSVLGAYAMGAYDEFIKNGNPYLVSTDEFSKWASLSMPRKMTEDIKAVHGPAPGKYMTTTDKNGESSVAVARIEFGNIAILPQPMPSEGTDINKLTHGVAGAPAYPYVASYLWTRHGFKADAIVHFGTHGSLEFIPGKQVALSDYDWSDALIGDMPHFYIYTINNIGEGIIAKRRSYATLISHLTAPFMEGEAYGNYKKLADIIHKIEHLDPSSSGALIEEYNKNIIELCRAENIFSTLGIDSTLSPIPQNELERIHCYIEEIGSAKVADGLYTLGEEYSNENLDNTTRLMSVDNIKFAIANLDVLRGRISSDQLDNTQFMSHRYDKLTNQIINKAMYADVSQSERIFASLVTNSELTKLKDHQTQEQKNNQRIKAMMQARSKQSEKKPNASKFIGPNGVLIPADTIAKHESTTPNPTMSMMDKMAMAKPQSTSAETNNKDQNHERELIETLAQLKFAVLQVSKNRQNLKQSTTAEQKALLNALSGGYTSPSSAGDPIVNNLSTPTGRNFYGINPETTPSTGAWKIGQRLAQNILDRELEANGKYPEKISFTLWSSDFISSEGATVAQILWLLGVEPLRDGFGYIRSLRLIPADQLSRPRIDVVVQTSGQLRDIAASRLELINRAIMMAAEDQSANNYVAKGAKDAERILISKGFSPVQARQLSTQRIFGGAGGDYGTGIMGMVEQGDSWESRDQIAKRYIQNMSALYSSNGSSDEWGAVYEGVFEAALLNTSVVIQPRSSNTWGPLSLDHVYEFMGGLSLAVEHVTGSDPTAYFNDFRNSSRAKVQELKESIGVEASSTIFNPKYIKEKLNGQSSSLNTFAETVRNTFGWNAMKPSAIDQQIWNNYYDVYVMDSHGLGTKQIFKDKNPYALQEITAIMLESARKGMWQASDQQIKELTTLHSQLVTNHKAACSGFVCDNAKLREFISQNLDKNGQQNYQKAIAQAREVEIVDDKNQSSVVLKKDEQQSQNQNLTNREESKNSNSSIILLLVIALGLGLTLGVIIYKRARTSKNK